MNPTDPAGASPDQTVSARRLRYSPEEVLTASMLIVMVLTLFAQIIARYVFSASFTWSEELSRYLFVWLVFIGLGAVTLRAEHVIVDALVAQFPSRIRRLLTQFTYVALIAMNILIGLAAAAMVYTLFGLGQSSPALGIPMWIVYLSLPAGMTVASLRLIQVSVHLWRAPHEVKAGEGGQ